MPSYDYNNISEFYSILKHFKTLEVPEALEILLPRYVLKFKIIMDLKFCLTKNFSKIQTVIQIWN